MTAGTVRPDQRAVDAVRVLGVVGYAVGLMTYLHFFGLPKQSVEVVAWIWLGTVAWDVRRPVGEHVTFLRDWWPPFAVLVFYLYSRGISDDLGIFDVHVTEPIEADRWLFGGTLPTEFLQAHLCGVPCDKTLPPAWYDVLLTTVYYSHFFAALGVGAYLWKRNREAWVGFMRRYLTVITTSVVCFVVYPMAPPWMASRDGYLTEDISRITSRGWFDRGTSNGGTAHQDISAVGNQVAAMPSLHAGLAILIAWWGFGRLRGAKRWLLVSYPVAMVFALVYYAEHYVVDAIAGGLLVAVVMVGWSWWERRHPPRRPEPIRDDATATNR
jgi:hypothetical protein